MPAPRISLDQWQALQCIVESGSYAAAAERLHKSQSTLSYAIGQIERLSGVQVFTIEGRRAQLTPAGEVLYRNARRLIEDATRLEGLAADLAQGWEAQLVIAVETIFPTWLLLECLARFSAEHPQTRLELIESVMGGTGEALLEGQVDFAIGPAIPQGFVGEWLMPIRFIGAAAPAHPLHQLGRSVNLRDLAAHRHLVVRDTGRRRTRDSWLASERRWTVSSKATAIRAATMGLGFSWFPEENIRAELDSGALRALPIDAGAYYANLFLIYPDAETLGPASRRLLQIIREEVARRCPPAPDRLEPAPPPVSAGSPAKKAGRPRQRRATAPGL